MELHANAATCPKSRALMARRVLSEGWSLTQAAAAAGVSDRTARKWVRRAQAGESLADRSSAPKRIPHRTSAQRVEAIKALRRLRMTAKEIAELLEMALSTVSLWLRRIGLGRRWRLEPPPLRYERARPGELLHVDIKKLGRIGLRGPGHRVRSSRPSRFRSRGSGWDCLHVAIDDATRLAYVEVLADEHPKSAVGFLERAIGWFAERGVVVERVLTDNGNPYRSKLHAAACGELGIRHLRTRPFRPETNGKAERFIQTLLREFAYAEVFGSSAERTRRLPPWLTHYNSRRRHSALGHKPPAARLAELQEQGD
jgi:transposase InsO family protein